MDKFIIHLFKTNKSNNQTNTIYHESNKPKYYGQINKKKQSNNQTNTEYCKYTMDKLIK